MKNALIVTALIVGLLAMGGLSLYEVDQAFRRYRNENEMLGKGLEALDKEFRRVESCARRQIESLLKVCDDNGIELCQGVGSSEWIEGPKPMTRKEFHEFKTMLLTHKVCGEVASFAHDTIVYRFPELQQP